VYNCIDVYSLIHPPEGEASNDLEDGHEADFLLIYFRNMEGTPKTAVDLSPWIILQVLMYQINPLQRP